jgi:DNA-binding FadR family transcriptional regulator
MVAGLDPAVRQWLGEPGGVRHLQSARLMLEVGLVRQAAETATEAGIARLGAALAENEAARGNLARFERTDVAFHYVLAELSGNPIFTALHEAMIGWLTEQRNITLRAPVAEAHAARSHRLIYQAVADRSPDEAEAQMRAHLQEVSQLYWQAREAQAA